MNNGARSLERNSDGNSPLAINYTSVVNLRKILLCNHPLSLLRDKYSSTERRIVRPSTYSGPKDRAKFPVASDNRDLFPDLDSIDRK